MSNNILSALHYLKIANYYFDYVRTEMKLSDKHRINKYIRQNNFIIEDVLSYLHDDEERRLYREQIKQTDSVSFASIMDKLLYLSDEQREIFEEMLQNIINGETITIEKV